MLQVGYQGFFFLALDTRLPAGILAVIVGFQPVLTALITRPERDYRLWAGLVMGIIGVATTVSSSLQFSGTRADGLIFATLALCAITVGTVLQGKSKTVGVWSSLALQSTLSSVVFAVVAVGGDQLWADGRATFYLSVGWMVVVVSVGATALLYFMVNRREVTRVASLFYCVPPVTALLDWLIIGRTLAALEILGLGIVVIAVLLTQIPKNTGYMARKDQASIAAPGEVRQHNS